MDGASSLDVLGSMDGLSSTDAVEVLKASLAADPATESDVPPGDGTKQAQAPGTLLGMSPAVQGMILLNISAALFGSNQVSAFALSSVSLWPMLYAHPNVQTGSSGLTRLPSHGNGKPTYEKLDRWPACHSLCLSLRQLQSAATAIRVTPAHILAVRAM